MRHVLLSLVLCGSIPLSAAEPPKSTTPPSTDAVDTANRQDDMAARRLLSSAAEILESKEFDRAISVYEQILRQYPKSTVIPQVNLALGRYYTGKKAETKALEYLQKILALEKEGRMPEGENLEVFIEGMYLAGVCQVNLKKYDLAFTLLRRLALTFPNTVWANQSYYHIGMAHFEQGNWAQAIENLSLVGTFVDPTAPAAKFLEAGRRLYIRVQDTDLPLEFRTALAQANIGRIEVITSTGDKEYVTLVPLAEKKGIYVASLPTQVAPVKPGDGVVQITGGAEVSITYFDTSTESGTPAKRSTGLTVASSAIVLFTRGSWDGVVDTSFIGQKAFFIVTDADEDRTENADQITVTVIARRAIEKTDGKSNERAEITYEEHDKLEMKLTEAPAKGSEVDPKKIVRSGRFLGTISLVKKGDAAPKHQVGELACLPGDEIVVQYIDKNSGIGVTDRLVTSRSQVLGEATVAPTTNSGDSSNPIISARIKLAEAQAILEISKIFAEMGLNDGAKQRADSGLEKVTTVVRERAQLPLAMREEAFHLQWELQLSKGDLKGAFMTCQLFSQYFPDSPLLDQALIGIAKVQTERGEFKEAMTIYTQVMKLKNSPNRALAAYSIAEVTEKEVYATMGTTASRAGSLVDPQVKAIETAAPLYRKMAEMFPDSPQAGEALAKVVDYYINTGDLTQAGDLLEQILANHPDKPWLHKMLLHAARLAFRNKNFRKAQDYCSQILVGYPTSTSKPDALDLMKRADAAMEDAKTKGGEGKADK